MRRNPFVMIKKFFVFFSLFLTACLCFALYTVHRALEQKVSIDTLIIQRDSTPVQIVKQLSVHQQLLDQKMLVLIIRFHPQFKQPKAGVFDLKDATSMRDVLTILNTGSQKRLSIQLIDGQRFTDFQKKLHNSPYLIYDSENVEQIIKEYQSLEGRLAPETIEYLPYTPASEIIRRLIALQDARLEQAWQNRAENLPLTTPYQLLILASLIEKETALDDEMPLIASVFVNRLRAKMKLQTDPSVIYGIEQFKGNLSKKDLQNPHLYNTYFIEGLPPTPIAMPSKKAIIAASRPAVSDFYYFVATGKGNHTFSRNYAEHQRAVRAYREQLRMQK